MDIEAKKKVENFYANLIKNRSNSQNKENQDFSNINQENSNQNNPPQSKAKEVQDHTKTREKILQVLKIKGPSLPVHLARETGISMLFAGAFLSELIREREVKTSNMKVGGSPIYLIPGQESKLEEFGDKFLKSREKEAFLKLKQNKVLKDSEQEPAIRVALRSLSDFAFPLQINNELYWRYFLTKNNETTDLIKKYQSNKQNSEKYGQQEKIKEKQIIKPQTKIKQPTEKKSEQKTEKESAKEKPLIQIKEQQKKGRKKQKSKFVSSVIEFLQINDIELLEEINFKKREYEAKTRINSDLGKIKYYVIAKNKKRVTDNDLTIASQKSQEEKMPVLFVSTGKLNKKAKEYLKNWENLIVFKQLNSKV